VYLRIGYASGAYLDKDDGLQTPVIQQAISHMHTLSVKPYRAIHARARAAPCVKSQLLKAVMATALFFSVSNGGFAKVALPPEHALISSNALTSNSPTTTPISPSSALSTLLFLPVIASGTSHARHVQPKQSITLENAGRVTQLARWGRGAAGEAAFSPDGHQLAIASTIGLYIYNVSDLTETRFIQPEPS
jgi:hypothetical protein